jgi:Galactose oxidase, central domain
MQRVSESFTASLPARLIVLLIGATFGTASIATAQSPGTFALTSDMTTPRSLHSATLLPNGQVLIAGGASGGVLASAEVYDPSERTFRAVGAMTTARRLHSATLLPDNRVLIVGGYGEDGGALASAEIFDPATGTFNATGSLRAARGFHTAILLQTGAVLVIGGYGTRAYPNVAPAELYDLASGVFRPAGAYVGRGGCDFCAPSVLLHDGTVLFPGEFPTQLYDPASDSFSPGGRMTNDLSGAAVLTNGQVLFAGGETLGRLANAELYNPATRTFARTGDMTSRRVWHTLSSLPNGMVLAAGGETDSCAGNGCTFAGSVVSAELYDPTAGTFSPTGNMAAARSTHSATLLGDGRVLVAGGVSYGGIGIFRGSLASAELYTPGVLVPTPALVSISGDGRGQGAIFHAGTSHVASAEDPSGADADVDIYCRGLTEESVIAPRVVIGGRIASVLSVTKAPDVPGANLLRVRVPRGVAQGAAVPVHLIHMDRPSNVVTMAVR